MRAEAEQQVYERLNMKIEDFVELGMYVNTYLCQNGVYTMHFLVIGKLIGEKVDF